MVWAAIGAAAVSVVGGAIAAHNSPSGSGNPGAAAAADPFASQRAQYQPMLQQLIANPSSVTNTPGYQFNLQQGLGGIQASQASMGLGSSGNTDAARETFASGLASNTYQQQFNNLSLLSGATSGNTGAASQAVTTGNNNVTAGISSIAGAAGKGLSSYLNSGSGSSADGTTSGPVIDPSTYTTTSSGGGFSSTNPWGGTSVGFQY